MVRALQGRLWHFAPDGTKATPPGCRQLRWSPVLAAVDWDAAVTTAEVMIDTTDRTLGSQSKMRDGGFWSIQAGSILAPLLHAAALGGRDMRRVMGWVMLRQLGEAVHILDDQLAEQRTGGRESAGTRAAFDLLQGADRTAPAKLSGYWGACNAALSPYRREAALAITGSTGSGGVLGGVLRIQPSEKSFSGCLAAIETVLVSSPVQACNMPGRHS